MGPVQARQQALVASRGSLPQPTSYAAGGPDVCDPALRGAPPPADVGRDELIPVVFTWTQGGQQVNLAASFNGWSKQIPMVRSGNEFHVVQDLPRGVHQYKFIVDDHWRFAQDQPKTQDGEGNMNNILDISSYQRWKLEDGDEQPTEEAAPQQRFGQHIPNPQEYGLDAPALPVVLGKSVLCAVPVRPTPTGSQPLSIPVHSLCDHVFMHDNCEGGADFGLAKVAVTHRFGNRYSTAVFVTRSPFDGCGFNTEIGVRGTNLLKKAVRTKPLIA